MSIISLVLGIALVGFVVYLVLLLPMPEVFRQIIIAVVCIALILYIIQAFGFIGALPRLR